MTQSPVGAVDAVLDAAPITAGVGEGLFAAVDTLDGSSALRRALSDPAAADQAKLVVIDQLFGARLGATALQVLRSAVGQRWSSAPALVRAVERQGVRALLKQAQAAGELDSVNEDLFRFNRVVAGDAELREALTGRSGDLGAKQALVDRLLNGRTLPTVISLAKRALKARQQSFAATLDSYGQLAAELRTRRVAKVTAAAPLTDEQLARLRAALVKQTGREVDLQIAIDPTTLGGLRVQVADDVIEGTVAGRLEQARRLLGS